MDGLDPPLAPNSLGPRLAPNTMIKIGSQCDGEMENRLAVITNDSLPDQNDSQCDGEMESQLAVIKKDSLPVHDGEMKRMGCSDQKQLGIIKRPRLRFN